MAGYAQLSCRDTRNLAHQVRITHGAEGDIVRKERSADHIVMAVDSINAPDDRDGDFNAFRVNGCHVVGVDRREPFFDSAVLLAIRTGIAAAQDRAEPVFLDLFGRDRTVVGLNDLADFLLKGHF